MCITEFLRGFALTGLQTVAKKEKCWKRTFSHLAVNRQLHPYMKGGGRLASPEASL
jgi:hypothetical protein